ncbi:MAG TPA: SDR family oxidoreductase [Geminicoccus sp.]|jgi:NAD(P)-dependent dehydrogenase (short-subunit alcohol dehydrogenase family)|uniref:SDR family NAD(P)-dependent oxidoreductase n=1 Tax=Geminicoccus sp. TaxID=2024832 RepID=UPI002E3245CE|nr:SDR family oxidoreductase [Geminicoccus sp.]HEX2528830.1 SDR family oxidoreductase [Geminicoccus sp.]
MDLGLRDKVAVITGGSIGIGRAVAHGLAAEGAHVVIAARQVERAEEAAAEVATRHDTRTLAVGVDVATAKGCEQLIAETTKAFGGADILINNAGTGSNETIREAADDKWQYYWDLHVMAAVRLGRGFAPSMIERGGGVILHNASICATQPLWYEPIYNTTKAALVMFSKNLANELIPHNVRVNAINLGLTLTPDWVKTATQLTEGTDRTWKDYIQGIADEWAPIKRFASPEEVADFFVFLCSSRASYSVGTTYYVDGGMTKCVV